MKIRIGLGLGTQSFPSPEGFLDLCLEMERVGIDSIWLSERLDRKSTRLNSSH